MRYRRSYGQLVRDLVGPDARVRIGNVSGSRGLGSLAWRLTSRAKRAQGAPIKMEIEPSARGEGGLLFGNRLASAEDSLLDGIACRY